MDVLVICSEEIAPLALVRCYPIGQIAMIDDGKEDIKILAVPFKDPNWNGYKDVSELPPHIIDDIKHFFGVYKQLEGKKMEVLELTGRESAVESIRKAIDLYNEVFLKD